MDPRVREDDSLHYFPGQYCAFARMTARKLLLEYIFDLKGVTIYRDGTRKDQILNRMEEDEVREYLDKETESTLTEEDVDCVSGTCEI